MACKMRIKLDAEFLKTGILTNGEILDKKNAECRICPF